MVHYNLLVTTLTSLNNTLKPLKKKKFTGERDSNSALEIPIDLSLKILSIEYMFEKLREKFRVCIKSYTDNGKLLIYTEIISSKITFLS